VHMFLVCMLCVLMYLCCAGQLCKAAVLTAPHGSRVDHADLLVLQLREMSGMQQSQSRSGGPSLASPMHPLVESGRGACVKCHMWEHEA
jgi:hypothetical protein